MLELLPFDTERFLTVASAMMEPLQRTWRLKKGTLAEYSVGFVKLTTACRFMVVLSVLNMVISPTFGFTESKPSLLEMAINSSALVQSS